MRFLATGMVALLVATTVGLGLACPPSLEEGFVCPPAAMRPQVWWHWMNGNVSKAGITADLEAMKAVGISGVHLVQVGHGIPEGPVRIFSDEWYEHVRFAAEECLRLGLELTLANCPGWTCSGGPWVPVEDSMKDFVFRTVETTGGAESVFVGRPEAKKDFYRDVATVAFPTPSARRMAIDPKTLVDLSSRLRSDGRIDWRVPAGKWTILRFGYTTTGQENFPAPAGGAGFEVDKLSSEAVGRHFDAYLGKLLTRLGPAGKAVRGVLVDSYEVGGFSWTEGFEKVFRERWRIDPKELYLTLSGHLVGSADRTAEIRRSFNRQRADMFARNYAGTLHRKAKERGLRLWLEPYATRIADDLQYARYCDVPMGEFWPDCPGQYNRPQNRNLASSAGHFWGRPVIAAEAFSMQPASSVSNWRWKPLPVKAAGDRAFSFGVNQMVIHSYAHQPWPQVDGPGMTMGPWGFRFERTEPWWRCMSAFLACLARSQWMLQSGRPVVDVLVYNGEQVPSGFVDFKQPGYKWDVCDSDGLGALRREGDVFVSPGGMRYRVLVRDARAKVDLAGVAPDFLCRDKRVVWTHRAYDDGSEAYFVASQATNEGEVVCADISFRQSGRYPELWYPESGEIRRPAKWTDEGGRIRVALRLEPAESVFVVFRSKQTEGLLPERQGFVGQPLNLDWKLTFPGQAPMTLDRLFDWSKSDDDRIRYFTGTASYSADLGTFPGGVIDFGTVRDFAEVFVDGRQIATLWKPPYRCRLPKGRTLEVRVVNSWPNRLIGDERTRKPDCGWSPACRSWLAQAGDCLNNPHRIPTWVWEGMPSPNGRAFSTWRHWRAEDELVPSGLIGPVTADEARPLRIDVPAGASLEKVALRVRNLPAEKKAHGVEIVLANGDYELPGSVVLTKEDGGVSPSAPVVWRAAERGRARILGARRIRPESFRPLKDGRLLARLPKEARGRVLVADVSTALTGPVDPLPEGSFVLTPPPTVFIDHSFGRLARWPNEGWATFTNSVDAGELKGGETEEGRLGGAFVFSDPRARRWNFEEGVWLNGYWTHDWYNNSVKALRYGCENGTNDVIRLARPIPYGVMGGRTWGGFSQRRFRVFNVFDELDAPGEWYLDRTRKLLYLYASRGTSLSPETEILVANETKPVLTVEASNVRFEGIAFEYASATFLSFRRTSDCEVRNCSVACVGANGIDVNGSRNRIVGCELTKLGACGIYVEGGDRRKLIRADNLVEGCRIHDFGVHKRTLAGAILVYGVGQTVRGNECWDAPHLAILYSGNEHLFESNDIHHVLLETADCGAVYTGRDWSTQGNVLRYNCVHELGKSLKTTSCCGFYFDDCDSGDAAYSNCFWKVARGILIGGGREHPVVGNVFAECTIGVSIDVRGLTWEHSDTGSWNLPARAESVGYRDEPWRSRYPWLANIMNDNPWAPLHNSVVWNAFVDCTQSALSLSDGKEMDAVIPHLDIRDNVVCTTSTNVVPVKVDPRVAGGFKVKVNVGDGPLRVVRARIDACRRARQKFNTEEAKR